MKVACLRVSFSFLAWQISVFFSYKLGEFVFTKWKKKKKWKKKRENSMIFRCMSHFAKVFNFKFGLIVKVCAKSRTIEIVLAN
jgi:hypothetical protein